MNELNRIFNVGNDGLSESDTIPLYKQIITLVSNAILSGKLSDGNKLPTEPELMKLFKVSRVTLRAAMQELEHQGLLERIQGKGTFIKAIPYKLHFNKYFGFEEACRKIGKSCHAELKFFGNKVPPSEVSIFLQREPGSPIPTISIVRFTDDTPAVIETAYWLNSSNELQASEEVTLENSVYKHLSRLNLPYKKLGAKFDYSASLPSPEEQEWLALKDPNTPLLVTTDWHYALPENRPLFVTEQKTNPRIINYYWERIIELP